MIEYPSISHDIIKSQRVYAFDKLDGSQIRAEWSRKKGGFSKFGTRTRLLGPDEPILGQAISLLREKYEADINKICKANKSGWQRVTLFFEFFGPNSFAGAHEEDDDFNVVLFDAAPSEVGFLGPREFLKLFADIDTAELLYRGTVSDEFIQSVRTSELEGMSFEGVICWGGSYPFKIKSQAWLDKLKDQCDSEQEYKQLK